MLHDTVESGKTFKPSTHCAAGGQEVDNVVVKLCHIIAYVQLGVFVSGAGIFLSHMHPQHRAHNPHNKSRSKEKTNKHDVSILTYLATG